VLRLTPLHSPSRITTSSRHSSRCSRWRRRAANSWAPPIPAAPPAPAVAAPPAPAVAAPHAAPAHSPTASDGGGGGDLLSQIALGKTLKHVSKPTGADSLPDIGGLDSGRAQDMMGLLKNAMANRNDAVKTDDDFGGDDEDADDWSD
jgi:hypothetical protein